MHLPQRLEDVLLLLRGRRRVRQLGLHRRLPGVVEQVAVVEPGGDDVVHEQAPGLRLLLRDSRDLAHGRRDRGVHALLRGDVRLLRPSRAGFLGAPQGFGVLVAERDLRLRRAGNLDQRAHDVLVLGISDGVVDLHVVGLDPAHAVVGDAVLFSGCRIDAHELGGDPIGVRHRFLRFRFFIPIRRLGEGGSDRDLIVRLGLDARERRVSLRIVDGLVLGVARDSQRLRGQRPGPTREERIDRGGVRLGHRSGVQDGL